MSENAAIGRTSIYIASLFLSFILQIPTTLATNISSLTALRFLASFSTSPALAMSGQASAITPKLFFPIMIVAALFLPLSIFIFGLTPSKQTHAMGSLVGCTCFGIGLVIILQIGFNYLRASLDYITSVFAGNN